MISKDLRALGLTLVNHIRAQPQTTEVACAVATQIRNTIEGQWIVLNTELLRAYADVVLAESKFLAEVTQDRFLERFVTPLRLFVQLLDVLRLAAHADLENPVEARRFVVVAMNTTQDLVSPDRLQETRLSLIRADSRDPAYLREYWVQVQKDLEDRIAAYFQGLSLPKVHP